MKRLTCLALWLITFSVGCGGAILPKETMLLRQTRYGEMEKLMEDRVSDMETASHLELFHLCTAYSKLKRYDKLFPCVDYLQQASKKERDSWWVINYPGISSMILAEAWMELGDYKKSVEEAERAYQLSKTDRANPHYKIWAPTVAGLCRALSGDRLGAEQIAAELETIVLPIKTHLLTSDKYMGLAKIYMALGDYQRALQTISRDRGQLNTAFDEILLGKDFNTFWELPKHYMLSKSMLETGDYMGAKANYDQLLQMPQTKQNGDIYWMILFDRGRIAETEGNSKMAIELYSHAIEIIEEQRSTINTEVSKIGFVGDKQEVYSRIISLLFAQARYSDAFEYVERAKARALVDMLASRDQFARTGAGTHQSSALIAKLNTGEAEAKVQDETITTDQSSQQRAVVIEIKEKIRHTDPELASLVAVTPPDVAEIQQLLPPDETLVEYFGSGDTFFAFILNHNEVRGVKLELTGLKHKVELFREQILISDSNKFKTEGQNLFEKLIQPIEPMIASKNLTIVSHGALHYLPFNALHDKDNFLIDRYNIRMLPSASVMKFLKDRREGHAGNLLALGNPDLGNPTYDLPWAQKEAIVITNGQPRSKLLIRNNATETALKRFGEQFRYIHFATHGTFDAEKPLSSGLLLAGDSENDGMLTVGELYDLSLPADLVTLSACETALGKVANGDDVVGFTRGFLYAGTSSIVSSLWKVDDKATSILMQQFYKSLKETDKRSALRTAQLKVKDTYNSHPYFWAAFQITGSVQ
jgi:CHAT domain-containing protein